MGDHIHNMMTVDVEDWFHILDADTAPERGRWAGLEERVVATTGRLLELFSEAGVHGTFFLVGWVAERQPGLVRRIADAGHEVASHSYWHEILQHYDRRTLSADLERSKKLLEDLSGRAVRGFRAPGASLTPATAWAFDLLVEQGFDYDASISPGLASHGGYPSPFSRPHRVRCGAGELVEIPWSTFPLLGRRIPYAGGGYLRLFPSALVRAALARDNRRGLPATVYLHPREIDPEQPRMELPWKRRFKYYVGLDTTERKLQDLLRRFAFTGCWRWIEGHRDALGDACLDVREVVAAHPPAPDPDRIPPLPGGEAVAG